MNNVDVLFIVDYVVFDYIQNVYSDQSDPFNRSPLSLQDVVPNTELKAKIEEWKAMKRLEAANK